jgi:hypothetical protein
MTMIEILNIKLKNMYNDKHFKNKVCSIKIDLQNIMLIHKTGKICIYIHHKTTSKI